MAEAWRRRFNNCWQGKFRESGINSQFCRMKKLLLRLFGAISAFTPLLAAAQVSSYELMLDDIDKAIAAEAWNRADSLIETAIRQDPGNPGNIMLLSNLGMIRFYMGQDSLALATLTDAHRMAPNSVTVLSNRARVNAATGHISDAILDYNAVELLDSTYTDTYLHRGFIYLYNGFFDEAEKDLSRFEKLRPDSEETLAAMATLYSIISRPAEALPYFGKLIADDPQPEYYSGRAMCLLQLDRLTDAADDIASGLTLDPDYGELYLARAILNQKRYERDAARRDVDRAIELGIDPQRVHIILGL